MKLSSRLTPPQDVVVTLLYVVIIIIVIVTVVAGGQRQLSKLPQGKKRYSSGSKSCRGGKYLVTT